MGAVYRCCYPNNFTKEGRCCFPFVGKLCTAEIQVELSCILSFVNFHGKHIKDLFVLALQMEHCQKYQRIWTPSANVKFFHCKMNTLGWIEGLTLLHKADDFKSSNFYPFLYHFSTVSHRAYESYWLNGIDHIIAGIIRGLFISIDWDLLCLAGWLMSRSITFLKRRILLVCLQTGVSLAAG